MRTYSLSLTIHFENQGFGMVSFEIALLVKQNLMKTIQN